MIEGQIYRCQSRDCVWEVKVINVCERPGASRTKEIYHSPALRKFASNREGLAGNRYSKLALLTRLAIHLRKPFLALPLMFLFTIAGTLLLNESASRVGAEQFGYLISGGVSLALGAASVVTLLPNSRPWRKASKLAMTVHR